ncbi:MAG: hypothetical protein J2O47_00030, partial [Acidimicrobiaceae bacterium]|nr:hypothetical protein [Acidimicrobiaceae bacterium]
MIVGNTHLALTRLLGRALLAGAALALFTVVSSATASAAVPAPAWQITSLRAPSNFIPSDSRGFNTYYVHVTNVGGAATDGSPITITDALPPGLTLNLAPSGNAIPFSLNDDQEFHPAGATCDPGPPASCSVSGLILAPGMSLAMPVPVNTGATTGTVVNHAVVSGGGASAASVTEPTEITASVPDFGFADSGFRLTDEAGDPITQAGSHPYLFDTSFELTSRESTTNQGFIVPTESLKDVRVTLPRGLVVNPTSTSLRCTEAELETASCPDASAVGLDRPTVEVSGAPSQLLESAIYNMVPPPGVPAELAFPVLDGATWVHLRGNVDAAGQYELTASADNVIQYGNVTGVDVELWGDPTDPSHDRVRGHCTGAGIGNHCPVPPTPIPFLTMPSACSPSSTLSYALNSWEHQSDFITAQPSAVDSDGGSVPVTGCDKLGFDPTLTARPDTAAADSSSGLDVELKVPQAEGQHTLATANLRRAVVTLPAGMAVNPSLADGLEACSPAEIGLDNADQPTCPDASKIGTVQVTTPLLDDPLVGSVYLAKQTDNPFGTLLALYIVAERDGAIVKLAGKVEPDPVTGQLKATFADNPELPFSDFVLHFIGGDRGALVTPPTCGTYQTVSKLSPWSAADPDSPTPAETVTSTDSFEITAGPGGGPCPDLADPSKFTPAFSAGVVSPQAGGSSPFVLKLGRPDGQQSIKQIHLDLPPGLLAHLKGVPKCPQSAIQPGIDGHADCPAGSRIGSVDAGAGAGSTPFFLTNQPVYLTDGYNGAPYGLAIDTDLIAGPFDLGHLVIRSTLNVDPDDAQVHVDSEEIPNIIQGIPLHVRSITVKTNPGFMLSPTNCNPMAVTGTVTGGGADFDAPADDTVKPVSDHFQVSGCGGLGFSPHLAGTILNGTQGIHRSDHLNLSFNLAYTPGDSNLALVSVLLPQSFQIDQANLGNICSETQLATNECAGR